MEWIFKAPILFFSVIFHEFAHGYVAYKHGDDTAYLSGRLTFNPLPHIDLFGTILLPVLCVISNLPMFGWARPVPVNPLRLNSPMKDMVKVAFAGPASNLFLALICVLLLQLVPFGVSLMGAPFVRIVMEALSFGVIVNLVLACFNLIPIAPLDGSNVLMGLLPAEWARKYQMHAPYGMWILLGLMITGLIKYLLLPPLYAALYILAKIGLNV